MAGLSSGWCSFYTRTDVAIVMQKRMLSDEKFRNEVVDLFVSRTMANLKECKDLSKRCKFDIEEVVVRTIGRVIDGEIKRHPEPQEAECLVWAPTQSGKTAYKAVKLACHISLGVLTILCTKGKTEAIGLTSKLMSYFEGSEYEDRILDVYGEKSPRTTASKFADQGSALGCTLVIPDTQKIRFASETLKLTKRKFKNLRWRFCAALILDECDATEVRSEDESQANERAMAELRALGMTTETRITATPLPEISRRCLQSKEDGGRPLNVFELPVQEDYVGIESLRLTEELCFESMNEGYAMNIPVDFRHDNNRHVKGLFPNDARQRGKKFPKCSRKHCRIPAWNEQCNSLIECAFEEISEGRTGALVLVGSCPWVFREDRSIFEQAAWVQDLFCAGGREFISVAVHAGKIYYRLPGHRFGYRSSMSIAQFGRFLGAIDDGRTPQLGFGVPVVVFGYHALKRSTSWRSDRRVPTHLILYHRRGQSIENVRQAAGRATFNGRAFLVENMQRNHIPTAMIPDDFHLLTTHDETIRRIIQVDPDDEAASRKRLRLIDEFRSRTKRKSGVFDYYRCHRRGRESGGGGDAVDNTAEIKGRATWTARGTKRRAPYTVGLPTTRPRPKQPRTAVAAAAGAAAKISSTSARPTACSHQPRDDSSVLRFGGSTEDDYSLSEVGDAVELLVQRLKDLVVDEGTVDGPRSEMDGTAGPVPPRHSKRA
jgi:hypothetical protein